MYVSIPTRNLGAWYDAINPFSKENLIYQAGYYYVHGNVMPPATGKTLPSAPPPVPQDNSFIPGSSVSDYLLNMVTGRPTDAQIQYNANQCVQNIQRMRQMQGGQAIPPGAETACQTDQEAYKKLIGGTAETLLANVIPNPAKITSSAIVALLAVGAGVYLVTR